MFEKLADKMLPRLTYALIIKNPLFVFTFNRDKVPAIRIEAVKAVVRLQDPDTENDRVISEFLKLLCADSNKYAQYSIYLFYLFVIYCKNRDVRKTVLKNIAISPITLPHILKRTRDNAADIRIHVYKVWIN